MDGWSRRAGSTGARGVGQRRADFFSVPERDRQRALARSSSAKPPPAPRMHAPRAHSCSGELLQPHGSTSSHSGFSRESGHSRGRERGDRRAEETVPQQRGRSPRRAKRPVPFLQHASKHAKSARMKMSRGESQRNRPATSSSRRYAQRCARCRLNPREFQLNRSRNRPGGSRR